jgi:hypothetical protein
LSGLTFGGFAGQEIEVLRLVADGLDTAEITASRPTRSARSRTSPRHC